MVIRMRYDASNLTEALDRAAGHATLWNLDAKDYNRRVNLMTCDGYIRTVA